MEMVKVDSGEWVCSEDAKFRHGIDQDYSALIQINPGTAKTRENQKIKKKQSFFWTPD